MSSTARTEGRPSALSASSITPSRADFRELARHGNLIPVRREILADLETPVSAFLKIHRGPYGFLLESVEGGEKWGRYSFLGTEPARVFRSRGRTVEIETPGRPPERRTVDDPFEALRRLLAEYRPVSVPGLPRFAGGAVGQIGYEMARAFERLPERAADDLGLPDACLLLAESLLVFDNVAQKIKVVSHVHVREGESLEAAYEKIVARAKEYIRAGDVIQVVLAQRFELPLAAAPFDVYRCLRTVNPSPYMFYLALGDHALAGASPEVMVRVEDGEVTVRPIAGTRPRGTVEREDVALAAELAADPKERAEHVMLLDLGRNDVGRVAAIGTVQVTESFVIERYSHVMHLVSNVRATLAPGRDCFDAFRATFPAGTLTGAPKIRAMEIIEELEPVRRGVYGGAVGYFAFSGAMDTAITIRFVLFRGGRVYVQAGAGIVADSNPEAEHRECVNKARAMLQAVRLRSEERRVGKECRSRCSPR